MRKDICKDVSKGGCLPECGYGSHLRIRVYWLFYENFAVLLNDHKPQHCYRGETIIGYGIGCKRTEFTEAVELQNRLSRSQMWTGEVD